MSEAYAKSYREIARAAAREMGLDLPEGVYAAVPGPSYETPAEIRYLRTIGATLWVCRPFPRLSPRITWECVYSEFPA